MKRMLQGAMLVLISLAVTLSAAEIALAIHGRYNDLASQHLVASPAIWERPANTTEYERHPDLRVTVQIRTDSDGVRNHSNTPTHLKRAIIGVFGDSFTENRKVDDQFTFTSLLDLTTGSRARVVNYGVGSYGLDQAYLRYKKYEQQHDLRHVVYVFCSNDLRNLYETGLADLAVDGSLILRTRTPNPLYRLLGRMRLTYLVIAAYYQAEGLLRGAMSRAPESLDWFGNKQAMRSYRARFHDVYADAIVTDLLSENPQERTLRLARIFLLLLERWKGEVEARGRTFTVLILPRQLDTDVAAQLLKNFDGRIVYSNGYFGAFGPFKFKRDEHWNEYGNLKAAELMANSGDFPFHQDIENPAALEGWARRIDDYYASHR